MCNHRPHDTCTKIIEMVICKGSRIWYFKGSPVRIKLIVTTGIFRWGKFTYIKLVERSNVKQLISNLNIHVAKPPYTPVHPVESVKVITCAREWKRRQLAIVHNAWSWFHNKPHL